MNNSIKLNDKDREIERLREIIQTQKIELQRNDKSIGIILNYNEELRNELAALHKPSTNQVIQTFKHLKVHHS